MTGCFAVLVSACSHTQRAGVGGGNSGLYLEKAWAEYMTLGITASFLPWEIFEVFRRSTWVRLVLLIVNVLVFLYLLKVVVEREKQKRNEEPSAA